MNRLDQARMVADAVLYEGYLLYPYRATSSKNMARWQFGVVGPRGAADAGLGEESFVEMQALMRIGGSAPTAGLDIYLRFLHLQRRRTERRGDDGSYVDVPEVTVGTTRWLAWDEAVPVEHTVQVSMDELTAGVIRAVDIHPGQDVEPLAAEGQTETSARLVRERAHVQATITATAEPVDDDGLCRLVVRVDNQGSVDGLEAADVIRRSLVGTHLLLDLTGDGAGFVSVIDPPDDARDAAAQCQQHRCWPVLAGVNGDESLLLGSPIILYDHPEIAEQSSVALFDSTEIDEILTLRVLTMTDQEKAEARATDPRAAEIVDRCEQMSPEDMQRLHGVLRDPFGSDPFGAGPFATGPSVDQVAADPLGADPFGPPLVTPTRDGDPFGPDLFGEDAPQVDPEKAVVLVNGIPVSKGSMVRVHPSRRADAQDLFFADQVARVAAVHEDFDGETHVAVVLVDDPAADMHEWYGRYLYFAPDEIEPLADVEASPRKENSS